MVAPDPNWTRRESLLGSTTPSYSVFTKQIEKSSHDDRDYRIIKLDNGLHATLVHDPKADKAAASLDVAVGHLYDPDDVPGLAHFCEHLLFMGTEMFPRENEYSEFLSKNNGSSNAFTSTSNTNYYFNVSASALGPALARFAAFFHCPLFSPSCTTRELNAVDSEHKKNLQSDIWRLFQVNKELSREGHPWAKFGSGDKESLGRAARELKARGKLNGIADAANGNASLVLSATPSPIPSRIPSPALSAVSSANSEFDADGGAVGRETRRRLVEWWSKEYCASRMRLCIIGNESLDELSDLASTLFSPVKNRGQDPLPMINEHPFGPNEIGTLVSVHTIMAFHIVEMSFPLAYQPPFYKYKPGQFVAHFIGHEGPGSLHSYLKNKGWITDLGVTPQNLGRGFSMFMIRVYLTKEGFQNYRAVTMTVFKYLSLLRSSAFPPWYQRELATLSSTRFLFAEKGRPDDYAVRIADRMSWPVPRELTLTGHQLTWPWEDEHEAQQEVRDVLEGLRVDKGRVLLMAQGPEHFDPEGKEKAWTKEAVYGTPYRVEKLNDAFVAEAQGPNDIAELFLPGPNEFIPTNLEVDKREPAQPSKRPYLIRQTPLSTLWYKKDDRFWVPKANVIIEIRSPLASSTAKRGVLTRLFADLVNDSLTEFSHDATLAGLSYNFASHTLGVYMTLGGYNDKLGVLARHVLEKVKGIVVSPERLAVMKEQLERDWQNFSLSTPHHISDYYARHLVTKNAWTVTEQLAEVSSVTVEEMQKHITELLSKVHVRMLVTGNIYKDDALRIAEMAESILHSSPIPQNEVLDRALILPRGSNYLWSTAVPNPNESNSALTYYLHMGSLSDPQLRVKTTLLAQILTEPAFNILRTKEQLGYIVSLVQWHLVGLSDTGIRIVVQSQKRPEYLEQRVESFLEGMKSMIENMTDEVFSEQKAGLSRRLQEKEKNLTEETNNYWVQIDSGYLDFLRRDQNAALLQQITKEDVLSLFMSHVHPSSATRAKLVVYLQSQKPRPIRIGNAASAAFEGLVREAGIPVVEGEWQAELGTDGSALPDFAKYWVGIIGNHSAAKDLSIAMQSLVERYPAETDLEVQRSASPTVIEDVKLFKQSLEITPEPRPIVEWGDLPVSKF